MGCGAASVGDASGRDGGGWRAARLRRVVVAAADDQGAARTAARRPNRAPERKPIQTPPVAAGSHTIRTPDPSPYFQLPSGVYSAMLEIKSGAELGGGMWRGRLGGIIAQ